MVYTAPKLIELLEKQHQQRGNTDLFKQGTFTLQWRSKVGSHPHPDLETMIPASEPCGSWKPTQQAQKPEDISLLRPEAKRNVAENNKYFNILPYRGYIPASSIRGLVRAWASKRPDIKPEMETLLGKQENDTINAGKFVFFDAYPQEETKVTLDIVNPQQDFQVYHQGQSTPLSFYTLGDGENNITVKVAIKGIEGKVTPDDVAKVWSWVEQALNAYGVGSRTASGYGAIKTEGNNPPTIESDPRCTTKTFTFSLYSQGCGGVTVQDIQLRPNHWRGWLRSWVLRFLLGVMSQENAQKTLGELMGSIDGNNNNAQKGTVRLEMVKGTTWGDRSEDQPRFYTWKGQLKITAPTNILNKIILPIIKFATSVGGVGRGWRRPLHIFTMQNGREASRGCHLILNHKVTDRTSGEERTKLFALSPNQPQTWQKTYDNWLNSVREIWHDRVHIGANNNLQGEVFSPQTCAIYLVPYPDEEPLDRQNNTWKFTEPVQDTRGEGMDLIYLLTYKRRQDVGGSAAGGGNSHCSWVSIKRVNVAHPSIEDSRCQEVVCVFMGGVAVDHQNHLRARFVRDLNNITGKRHLFGVNPN